MTSAPVILSISHHQTVDGIPFQLLDIQLTTPDRIIQPKDIAGLILPRTFDADKGVIISGRGPMWLCTAIVYACQEARWIANYEPRYAGAVIGASRCSQVQVGQVLPLALPQIEAIARGETCSHSPGPALMVVGPPDSGKSVLSHALFKALLPNYPNIYLQRAQWDGEGNYTLELPSQTSSELVEAFKASNKGQLTEHFFQYHADAVATLRQQKSLVIVDVGGMVQDEKLPLLKVCTHYLIISSKPEAVGEWHQFCQGKGQLAPLGVIHSRLENCNEVHQQQPYLELTCGPWIRGSHREVPPELQDALTALTK